MYPPEFLDFLKYFLSTFLWIRLKPKQSFCISKYLLNDVWMFLQHWATCWCRRPSVSQTISVAGVSLHVLTIRRLLWSHRPRRGNMWCKVLHCWLVLFKWQYTTWKYNYFTLFCALKLLSDFFVFLVRISKLYSCNPYSAEINAEILMTKVDPHTVTENIFRMAVDPQHRYSNEAERPD